MNPGRRTVMKGMLAGGVAATLGGLPLMKAAAFPPAAPRAVLLLPEGSTGVSLLRALQATAVALQPQRVWHLPDVPDQRLLRCTAGLELLADQPCLALLSEANIVLLREWARSAGKALLWTTAPALSPNAGGAAQQNPELLALSRALMAPFGSDERSQRSAAGRGKCASRLRLASLALQL